MKFALQGRRFHEFLELLDQSLHAVSKGLLQQGLWQKRCVNSEGYYFEGDNNDQNKKKACILLRTRSGNFSIRFRLC
jgi:hypothetical protein